jgi:hypothetical protein
MGFLKGMNVGWYDIDDYKDRKFIWPNTLFNQFQDERSLTIASSVSVKPSTLGPGISGPNLSYTGNISTTSSSSSCNTPNSCTGL